MSGCRVLVTVEAGRVRWAPVDGGRAAVPWAPGVRARAVGAGVRLEGAGLAPGDVAAIGLGTRAWVGGRSTTCLPARCLPGVGFEAILGTGMAATSPAMLGVFHRAVGAAHATEPLLLLGESGTGKDVLARAVHELGPRAGGPFVALNLAALPRDLVESELFGCVRGAFTGAFEGRPGAFEAADGGTLFLDELAEAPIEVQAKLLRVVESGTVRRIGAAREARFRVRVIAATNREPAEALARGSLRADLAERLGCLVVRLPPLRERIADLPGLAAALLGADAGPPGRAALAVLAGHAWPGNVRELRNVLSRARWLDGHGTPGPEALAEALATGWRGDQGSAGPGERGSRRRQIDASGLARSTFYYRLKRGRIPLQGGAEPPAVSGFAS